MIISCPSCSSKFAVKSEAIGEKGRNVKCAKCAHKWFQKPDEKALEATKKADIEEEPKQVDPVPKGGNLPSVQKEKTPIYAPILLAASVMILAVVITIAGASSILPGMQGYYSIFGIYDSSEIALYDVDIHKEESGKYTSLVIKAKIVNQSEETKKLPNLRISIYDDKDELLDKITLDSQAAPIEAGQSIDFKNKVPKIPSSAAKVVMDLGNKFELSRR